MGRRDAEGRSDLEKFRSNLGKQEFKGRSKKSTLSIRSKAQSKKSTGTTVKVVVLYLFAILALLVSIYFVFYTVYANNKKKPRPNWQESAASYTDGLNIKVDKNGSFWFDLRLFSDSCRFIVWEDAQCSGFSDVYYLVHGAWFKEHLIHHNESMGPMSLSGISENHPDTLPGVFSANYQTHVWMCKSSSLKSL